MARGTDKTTPSSAAERLHRLLTPTDLLSDGAGGVLHIDGHSAERLLRRYGSPVYVLCEKTLRANYRRIKSAFAGAWPGEVCILYAAKANNGLEGKALIRESLGYDRSALEALHKKMDGRHPECGSNTTSSRLVIKILALLEK